MTDSTSECGENGESDSENPSVAKVARSKLSIALAAVFCLSVIMGTGPGVLLVNRPESIGGIPLVYAWGIFWYCVQVAVVIVASLTVWRSTGVAESCRTHNTPSRPERKSAKRGEGELPR